MPKVFLTPQEQAQLEAMAESIQDLESQLDSMDEAGTPLPGLRAELEKMKKTREVYLRDFTQSGESE